MPTSSKKGKRSLGRTGAKYLAARKRVLASNQICAGCGELIDMDLVWPDPMYATVDHIKPVSAFESRTDPGLWAMENLRPMHLSCNSKRGKGTIKLDHPTSRNWCE